MGCNAKVAVPPEQRVKSSQGLPPLSLDNPHLARPLTMDMYIRQMIECASCISAVSFLLAAGLVPVACPGGLVCFSGAKLLVACFGERARSVLLLLRVELRLELSALGGGFCTGLGEFMLVSFERMACCAGETHLSRLGSSSARLGRVARVAARVAAGRSTTTTSSSSATAQRPRRTADFRGDARGLRARGWSRAEGAAGLGGGLRLSLAADVAHDLFDSEA